MLLGASLIRRPPHSQFLLVLFVFGLKMPSLCLLLLLLCLILTPRPLSVMLDSYSSEIMSQNNLFLPKLLSVMGLYHQDGNVAGTSCGKAWLLLLLFPIFICSFSFPSYYMSLLDKSDMSIVVNRSIHLKFLSLTEYTKGLLTFRPSTFLIVI